MSWQADINTAILANSPLVSLIGGAFSWDVADGTVAPPYLVAQTISGQGETTFSGTRPDTFPLLQITAWAKGRDNCIAIISALRTAIEGFNLPGDSNVSLGFSGEHSTYDEETKLSGEIIEYRVSALTN